MFKRIFYSYDRIRPRSAWLMAAIFPFFSVPLSTPAATNVYLLNVPDYEWYYGCMGSSAGNLMGYWDRCGMPDIYTGPTSNGVAPLTTAGNSIRALWASQAGVDGRAAGNYGHVDDYWVSYQSTGDPYVSAGRPEHSADCIGDFMGLSQYRWTNMNGECKGNKDAFSFNYWDTSGVLRVNYQPGPEAGIPARDIQSGLAAFADWRGYDSDTFSQLADAWWSTPAGQGFTFSNLMDEIDAGYPVLLFLQAHDWYGSGSNNPNMHGLLAYGYRIDNPDIHRVYYRDPNYRGTLLAVWTNFYAIGYSMHLRGIIGFHPKPKLVSWAVSNDTVRLAWHAPLTLLYDAANSRILTQNVYVVEKSVDLAGGDFEAVTGDLFTNEVTFTSTDTQAVYRLRRIRR